MTSNEPTPADTDETGPSSASQEVLTPEWASTIAPFIAGRVDAENLQANLACMATVHAENLQANLSALVVAKTDFIASVGSANGIMLVSGDADVNTSAVPILSVKGDVDFHQAYASAVIAGGTVEVRQGGAPLMLAKELKVKYGGGAVLIAGKAKVKHGFVGVLLAREAEMSEDTRILLDSRSALVVGAALFGGLALVAMALLRALPSHHPHRPNHQ